MCKKKRKEKKKKNIHPFTQHGAMSGKMGSFITSQNLNVNVDSSDKRDGEAGTGHMCSVF